MAISRLQSIEAEIEIEAGETSLEFEVGRLEAELELEVLGNGMLEVGFETETEEFEFVFSQSELIERRFSVEVGGQTYLVELEAGRDDEEPELFAAEAEITPTGWIGRPRVSELELEVSRGDSGEGSVEVRGFEFSVEAEAFGRRFAVEVEIENERTGRSVEREFLIDPTRGFEREFELTLGPRTFVLELETEFDRPEGEFVAELEFENPGARPDADVFIA